MSTQEISNKIKDHQLDQLDQFDQMALVDLKFQTATLDDRNIWRNIITMNHFHLETQWKRIVDLQIAELFDQIPINNHVLEYLCFKNHHYLLDSLIKNDVNKILNLNVGLSGACRGGHQDLVQMMINLGARDWNKGLSAACRGGHQDLGQWMIDLGATNKWRFQSCFPFYDR